MASSPCITVLLLSACFVVGYTVLVERNSRKTNSFQYVKSSVISRSWYQNRDSGDDPYRHRRDSDSCGLTTSDILEVEPVSDAWLLPDSMIP